MDERQIGMDDQRRSSVAVEIAGEEYTIRAVATPEHTRRCAAYVDDAIREVSSQSPGLETQKAAMLAALSLADQLFQANDRTETLRREMDGRAQGLARKIVAHLESPSAG